MPAKRRRSSTSDYLSFALSKRTRTRHPDDHIDSLSDELLIYILQLLPLDTLVHCQRLSHRFYTLAGDSQIWKNQYYTRFVLPRALRIPGIRNAPRDDLFNFSSKRSRWLGEDALVNPVNGTKTNWKGQYKLRHNWSIGSCDIQEIHVADQPAVPSMQVKLAEKVVVTADKEEGLRAWGLKGKELIARCRFEGDLLPTCLSIDEQSSGYGLGVAVGFVDGGWGVWSLDIKEKKFIPAYKHPESSNGRLGAIAYSHPYVLTITDSQRLSLYTFSPEHEAESSNADLTTPRLLASLQSHTSWPPLSLSLRPTTSYLVASIAYTLPVYPHGYTVGIQELHFSPLTGSITSSRLASALPQGFTSLSSSPALLSPGAVSSSPIEHPSAPPTSLSYAHPYILTTHSDNTLSLHLCTSTASTLSLSPATRLWGHTASVVAAQITTRGKAVSVSGGAHTPSSTTYPRSAGNAPTTNTRESYGGELRIWDLEGSHARRRRGRSVKVGSPGSGKRWVGFDEEVVVVLEEEGGLVLTVHDFT